MCRREATKRSKTSCEMVKMLIWGISFCFFRDIDSSRMLGGEARLNFLKMENISAECTQDHITWGRVCSGWEDFKTFLVDFQHFVELQWNDTKLFIGLERVWREEGKFEFAENVVTWNGKERTCVLLTSRETHSSSMECQTSREMRCCVFFLRSISALSQQTRESPEFLFFWVVKLSSLEWTLNSLVRTSRV